MEKNRHCLYCGAPIYGRTDKMFCSDHCKDNWHNTRRSLIRKTRADVLDIIESNYEILENLMASGRTIWLTTLLEALGFKMDYFTRLVSLRFGAMVCECFDIRYRVTKTKLWGITRISVPPPDRRDLRT